MCMYLEGVCVYFQAGGKAGGEGEKKSQTTP